MFVLFNYYTTMEKLLNLLNEYESESWIIKDEDIVKVGCDDYWLPCIDSYKLCIISKSYWFIDWLVKNDKIEREKTNIEKSDDKRYDEWIVLASNYDNDTYVVEKYYSYTEQLLMILSIQDNPIEYLCSILK